MNTLKKTAIMLTILFIMSVALPADAILAVQKTTYVSVNVNGQRLNFDASPFISNGRTLVPLRGVFEKLGATVQWYEDTQKIIITFNDKIITLNINSTKAYINDNVVYMDTSPLISNNRTMIPLRFIGENIGMNVGWIESSKLATITEPLYFSTLPSNNVLGFTTNDYKGDNAPHNSLVTNIDKLDLVATFSYQVLENGSLKLTGVSQDESVKLANANNIKPLVLIHNLKNGNFDKNVSHAVLSSAKNRKTLINNILSVMSSKAYAGVNIDIENVYWYDRSNYTLLIKELKQAISPYGFLTTVSIPAKSSDSSNNSWNGAFDYEQIGKYADQILLMTYDEHYVKGSPGPIASLPWVESVLTYATSLIPSNKILLGIAGYGYDWSNSGNKAIAFKNVDTLISEQGIQTLWDDNAKSPYFTYYKDTVLHTIWYENSESINNKIQLVEKYNLGGIGIWKLGYDNETFWKGNHGDGSFDYFL